MRSSSYVRLLVSYTLLMLGALIFGWPFIWMAATSIKLEREIFRDRGRILPETPTAPIRSPYVDERAFPRGRSEIVEIIEKKLASHEWPVDLDVETTRRTAARGVYQHLLNTWSGEQWNDPGAQQEERIAKAITPELLDNVLAQCRRSFCIGQLQACSIELEEDRLVGPANETQTWALSGPGRLEQKNAAAGGYAELHYDFRAANRLV